MPTRKPISNEAWLVEVGDEIIRKRANVGAGGLSSRETLLYWLWWANHMMLDAGDFANAVVLEVDFQQEIVFRAKELGLGYTAETFSLPRNELERSFFERFDRVCEDVRPT